MQIIVCLPMVSGKFLNLKTCDVHSSVKCASYIFEKSDFDLQLKFLPFYLLEPYFTNFLCNLTCVQVEDQVVVYGSIVRRLLDMVLSQPMELMGMVLEEVELEGEYLSKQAIPINLISPSRLMEVG